MKLGWSDVTPRSLYLDRRRFMAGAAALAASPAFAMQDVPLTIPSDEPLTDRDAVTSYNNYIEFGYDKGDPKARAAALTLDPWSVRIDGLVDRPGSYGVEDLAPSSALEQRIYRMRCVEGWFMVIPWIGVPLAPVLQRAGVQPSARFVVFETVLRPEEMPMQQRSPSMPWPYREGLRLDEAMHPLTMLATGIYDEPMPPQNGAPIRLVVPWKYGFKSAKSVVRITLSAEQPATLWNDLQPTEYGFYANVNPQVDHPRWSQATERRIGAGLLAGREPTPMFNGYAEQVAQLYAGMDLAVHY